MNSEAYLKSWDAATTAWRLKKMAESIAAFCRSAKRRNGVGMDEAITGWKTDLAWLKRTYYDGRFDGKFAWPDTL